MVIFENMEILKSAFGSDWRYKETDTSQVSYEQLSVNINGSSLLTVSLQLNIVLGDITQLNVVT